MRNILQRIIGLIKSGQSEHQEIPESPNNSGLDRLIAQIEANGGSSGLDLSGQDFSGLDLSRETIKQRIQSKYGYQKPGICWQSQSNGGLNLREAILVKTKFLAANLSYADLKGANLEGAILQAVDLSKASLYKANLRSADVSQSNLCGAYASGANFEWADLSRSDLSSADLDFASLKNASLYKAVLSGTQLSRRSIGKAILQENAKDLAFFLRNCFSPPNDWISTWIHEKQYEVAQQIYSTLKANFISIGNLDDASWAHIKQRQMFRKTHWLKYARIYYSDELPPKCNFLSWRWWRFYISHMLKWWFDWVAEVTCGYGESPVRTIYIGMIIVIAFSFIYMWTGGIDSHNGMIWLDYFNYSLGTFATINFSQWMPVTSLAQTLTSLEAISGISIFALLMFSLGNRISRS